MSGPSTQRQTRLHPEGTTTCSAILPRSTSQLTPTLYLLPFFWIQLSIEANQAEKDLAIEREASRQRKLAYQNELLKQIEDYKSRVLNNDFDMNNTEHLLNKQVIQKAKSQTNEHSNS